MGAITSLALNAARHGCALSPIQMRHPGAARVEHEEPNSKPQPFVASILGQGEIAEDQAPESLISEILTRE
jgi:hypothetical protein